MTYRIFGTALLLAAPSFAGAQGAVGNAASTRVCIAPAAIESAPSASDAMTAIRDAFSAMLAGPGITPVPLQAKLQSLVRDEAKQSNCAFLLLPTFKHIHKTSGAGLLGKAAFGAVEAGAYEVSGSSTAARVAAGAAHGAANQAEWHYSYSVKTKDEMTLSYRLESATGQVLSEDKSSRKAQSDGEDVLTPLVQKAAEKIVSAVKPSR
jgi:hypothetical protein